MAWSWMLNSLPTAWIPWTSAIPAVGSLRQAPIRRLLLQVDTDDGLGMMWEDGGLLYFWISNT